MGKNTNIVCNVHGAKTKPMVNGSYLLQKKRHIKSKYTMLFRHEHHNYTLARFKIGGKYGWIIGQDRKAIYGVRTEELLPPQKGWKSVNRGTFSEIGDEDNNMTVVVIEHTLSKKNGDEETIVLNEPKKDAKNYLVDVGGGGGNKQMLSYALMDETIGTLPHELMYMWKILKIVEETRFYIGENTSWHKNGAALLLVLSRRRFAQ